MLSNRQKSPNTTLPIATIFLAISILWPKIIHPASQLTPSWDDFLRGGILGLSIGMILMTGINMRRQRRCGRGADDAKGDTTPRM